MWAPSPSTEAHTGGIVSGAASPGTGFTDSKWCCGVFGRETGFVQGDQLFQQCALAGEGWTRSPPSSYVNIKFVRKPVLMSHTSYVWPILRQTVLHCGSVAAGSRLLRWWQWTHSEACINCLQLSVADKAKGVSEGSCLGLLCWGIYPWKTKLKGFHFSWQLAES